jgi:hypothetical protein
LDATSPALSATKALSIVVNSSPVVMNPPVITTLAALSNGIVGNAYSQKLDATAGTSPYSWQITGGALPGGLTLASGGTISGVPTVANTFNFTATVTDAASQTASRTFTIVIAPTPSIGSLTVVGLPATPLPAQQLQFGITLSPPSPNVISGTLTISFTPNAVVPIDDPAIQFSTGSRTISFTIPANTTTALIPSQALLSTGTVAGTVNLIANIQNGPSNLTIGSLTLAAVSPRMNTIVATRTSTGLDIQIIGYSPERRVSSANFVFSFKAAGAQQATLTRNVEADFSTWYQSAGSVPFGSTFRFVQSFLVQGDTSQLDSVAVTLTNGQGSTSFGPVPIPAN